MALPANSVLPPVWLKNRQVSLSRYFDELRRLKDGSADQNVRGVGGALVRTIESQMSGGLRRVYHAGESFYEDLGAHHVVSRNARATEPAKLLAVFVVKTNDKTLTTPHK